MKEEGPEPCSRHAKVGVLLRLPGGDVEKDAGAPSLGSRAQMRAADRRLRM